MDLLPTIVFKLPDSLSVRLTANSSSQLQQLKDREKEKPVNLA